MQNLKESFRFLAIFTFLFAIVQGQSSLSNYRSNQERRDDIDIYGTQRNQNSIICMDIDPQRSLDMKQIMGKWYGNEIIIHTQDVPGVFHYHSCVSILIEDATDQMSDYHLNTDFRRTSISTHHHDQYRPNNQQQQHQIPYQHSEQDFDMPRQPTRYLRLVWTESGDTLEYIFNYSNDSLGRWTNVGEQRGSLVALNHYRQFNGIAQVVKAVNDHLVLTFCGNEIKSSIYTIVLSRNPDGLSSQELYSIRGLLKQRHLPTDTIRKICSSAADGLKATFKIILLLLAITLIVKKL